jgi:tetratricopeptide (TPR) repeat protein
MGRFQESQSYLEKALAFDQGHKGPVFEDLTELARLNFDQKKYLEAVEFYKLDFEILDQIDASRRSPGAYCDLLEEYAASLSAAARESESNLCRAKLVALTKEFPNRRSITDRTPYGKYLSGNSHSGDRTSH